MQNYIRKISALVEAGVLHPQDLVNLEIWHDPSCPILRGEEICDCDPDLEVHVARDLDDFVSTYLRLTHPRQ